MSWNISKLGEECEIFSGNSINAKTKESLYTNVEGIPYIATKDIDYDGKINYLNGISIPEEDQEKFKKAKSECVFICAEGGSAGRKIAFSDTECFFVNKLFCLESGSNLVPKYVYYYLKSEAFQIQFKNALAGLIGGVSLTKIKLFDITYPSLLEQKQIVEKLDAAFNEIEKAISATKENIENAEALLAGYISQTIHHDLGDYESCTIDDICSGVEYGSSTKSLSKGKVPVIRMGNLVQGEINLSDLVYTDDEDEITKYCLNVGDVLFNRTNSTVHVGKTGIYRDQSPAIFAGYLIRIKYDKELVDPEFLNLYMNSREIREYGFSVMSHSINQANINGTKLKDYPFKLIPLDHQKSLVIKIDKLKDQVAHILFLYKNKIQNLDMLKSSILNQAFSGEFTKDAA